MNPNDTTTVIEEIREARHRISERFDHDPERLIAYYIEMQERYRDRLVQGQQAPEKQSPSAV